MNDELLVLTRREEGIETYVGCISDRDAFGVAVSLFQLLSGDNPVAQYFATITQLWVDDESFREQLDESTVTLPDFNKLLQENGS